MLFRKPIMKIKPPRRKIWGIPLEFVLFALTVFFALVIAVSMFFMNQ